MKELRLPCKKLRRVTIDEPPSIKAKETGLMGTIRREVGKLNPEFYTEF
jgi:hypothetical protein